MARSSSTLNSNHEISSDSGPPKFPLLLASSVFYNPSSSSRRRRRRDGSSSSFLSNRSANSLQPGAGCCTSSPSEDWMNWVEQSIDFFGCEAQNDGFLGKALALAKKEFEAVPRDYCKLHEEFFESLLKEQLLQDDFQELEYCSTGMSDDDTSQDSGMISSDSLPTTSTAPQSSTNNSSSSSTHPSKKRIPYFQKKLSPRRTKRIAPIEAYNQQYNPALLEDADEDERKHFSLPELMYKDLPEPQTLVHVHCQLQKDKGKGVPLGASVCAEGREETLLKLRDKMKLVLQVSGDDRKSSIKRRPAKVANDESPMHCETRSMIELKLGFLSLNYGLLLKWDCRTGQIIFVCLRKMCHESSFYKKMTSSTNGGSSSRGRSYPMTSPAVVQVQRSELEAPPFVVVSKTNNEKVEHALYQRKAGTEVVLVDEPYRVAQDDFGPSMITLQILQVTGLSLRKKWTISVTFGGHTEWVRLDQSHHSNSSKHNSSKVELLVPRRPSMIWQVNEEDEDEFLNLEIALFESPRRRRAGRQKLTASMTLPLASLIAQPTVSKVKSWSLTMPLSDTGRLTLNLQHRSDYTHWLYQELDKRRLEEVAYCKQQLEHEQYGYWYEQEQRRQRQKEEEPAFYDWLCGVCLQ
eukprot:scaffold2962_cov126-Cylindrotheca_fusiformis.AAC.21